MSNLSRRDALKLSLLTGAMPFVRHGDLPRLRTDRLRLGVVGVGNRGAANLAAVSHEHVVALCDVCLLYTSPSPRDRYISRMPSSA